MSESNVTWTRPGGWRAAGRRPAAGAVGPREFEEMIADAIDELPEEFARVLDVVPVIVSDNGAALRLYGLYHGDGVSRDNYPDRIVIFRDTLTRDFGHDRSLLRAQIRRTLRHELAHHLGWGEPGVRELGL